MCAGNFSDFKEDNSTVRVHLSQQNKTVFESGQPALTATQIGHPRDDKSDAMKEERGDENHKSSKTSEVEDSKSKRGPCNNEDGKTVEGERRDAAVSGVDGVINTTPREDGLGQSLRGLSFNSGIPFPYLIILTVAVGIHVIQLPNADKEPKSPPATQSNSNRVENGLEKSAKEEGSGGETSTFNKAENSPATSKSKTRSETTSNQAKKQNSSAKSKTKTRRGTTNTTTNSSAKSKTKTRSGTTNTTTNSSGTSTEKGTSNRSTKALKTEPI
jgi:hypothetical protein